MSVNYDSLTDILTNLYRGHVYINDILLTDELLKSLTELEKLIYKKEINTYKSKSNLFKDLIYNYSPFLKAISG